VNASIRAAIAAIPGDAWVGIGYPQALWDDQLDCRVSGAEVAGTGYTAFTSKKKSEHVTARLIVRRVRALNEEAAQGQGELFPVYRYHAVFTDSPFETVPAEGDHRDHAIVEQVFADLNAGPSRTCHPGISARTRHGSPSPPWLITCCDPPRPGPGLGTPGPGPPRSAAT
jgi:hypothetical protein